MRQPRAAAATGLEHLRPALLSTWWMLCVASLAGCAGKPDGPRQPQPASAPAPITKERSCPESCTGSASDALQDALRSRAQQAGQCYEAALASDPTLAGRLLVTLTLSETGGACSVVVTSTTLDVPSGLARCLERHFDSDYPPPTGGCVRAVLPLMLKSDADGGA